MILNPPKTYYDHSGHAVLIPTYTGTSLISPTELKPIPARLEPPPQPKTDYLRYAEIALLLTALASYTIMALFFFASVVL